MDVDYIYNESELKRCLDGEMTEFALGTKGHQAFKTQAPKNAQYIQLLNPPSQAKEALRWFRQGFISSRKIDQYLFYFFALESIVRHLPGVTRGPRLDENGKEIGLESTENAGIKFLISRRTELPPEIKRELTSTCGRTAHGNANENTLSLVAKYLPILQRLVLDGIALVYGLMPETINILPPNPMPIQAVWPTVPFSHEENPLEKWGSLLSDVFNEYSSKMVNGI